MVLTCEMEQRVLGPSYIGVTRRTRKFVLPAGSALVFSTLAGYMVRQYGTAVWRNLPHTVL